MFNIVVKQNGEMTVDQRPIDEDDLDNMQREIDGARRELAKINSRKSESGIAFIEKCLNEMRDWIAEKNRFIESVKGPVPEEEGLPPRSTWRQGVNDRMDLVMGPLWRFYEKQKALLEERANEEVPRKCRVCGEYGCND